MSVALIAMDTIRLTTILIGLETRSNNMWDDTQVGDTDAWDCHTDDSPSTDGSDNGYSANDD